MESHRDLLIWQKAMDLVLMVYRLAEQLPSIEINRLTGFLLRAVISVPANIADGQARQNPREFASALQLARGGLMETDTLLNLAVRLNYLTEPQTASASNTIGEVNRMIGALRRGLIESAEGGPRGGGPPPSPPRRR